MQDVWFGKIWSEEINVPTGWGLGVLCVGIVKMLRPESGGR